MLEAFGKLDFAYLVSSTYMSMARSAPRLGRRLACSAERAPPLQPGRGCARVNGAATSRCGCGAADDAGPRDDADNRAAPRQAALEADGGTTRRGAASRPATPTGCAHSVSASEARGDATSSRGGWRGSAAPMHARCTQGRPVRDVAAERGAASTPSQLLGPRRRHAAPK